jgi:osomolarity two-component system phosphorelay intermediate protein YPD1
MPTVCALSLHKSILWYNSKLTVDFSPLYRKEGDLPKLASLGHYLKGSSATLGMVKVRDGCEKIQRFGKNENLDGSAEPDNVVCLSRIGEALDGVKKDYKTVEEKLREHYNNL